MGFTAETLARLDCDCCGHSAGGAATPSALWPAAESAGWTRTPEGYWCPLCAAPEHDRAHCRVAAEHRISAGLVEGIPGLVVLSCSCGGWRLTSNPLQRAADESLHHVAIQMQEAGRTEAGHG